MTDGERPPRKCPACGGPVDPGDPSTVTAWEQRNLATFQEPVDYHDGFKFDFHAGCFPQSSPLWRRADD
jgi:hypothetical protein